MTAVMHATSSRKPPNGTQIEPHYSFDTKRWSTGDTGITSEELQRSHRNSNNLRDRQPVTLPRTLSHVHDETSIERWYNSGKFSSLPIDGAPTMDIGLLFLESADVEEADLDKQLTSSEEPHQRDQEWRVNTATQLWSLLDPSARSYIQRHVYDNSNRQVTEGLTTRKGLKTSQLKENLSKLGHGDPPALRFHGQHIRMVRDLRFSATGYDFESALIEIDVQSFRKLKDRLESLIESAGNDSAYWESSKHLQAFREISLATRHFCMMNPLLFRMSVRVHISRSKNIHYGHNTESQFMSVATDKSIRDLVLSVLSLYDCTLEASLQHSIICPLSQAVVLLLSLLTDSCIQEISPRLTSFFNIKIDGGSLELLFLKVLPLRSRSPEVFLHHMILACEFESINRPELEKLGLYWDYFLVRALYAGFFLPGHSNRLGRVVASWLVKWSPDGFTSSEIFENLQYEGTSHGETEKGTGPLYNRVPRILAAEEDNGPPSPASVQLANGLQYTVKANDFLPLLFYVPGSYNLTDSQGCEKILNIEEEELASGLRQALNGVKKISDTVKKLKKPSHIRRILQNIGLLPLKPDMASEVSKPTPHINQLSATIDGSTLIRIGSKDSTQISLSDAAEIIGKKMQTVQYVFENCKKQVRKLRFRILQRLQADMAATLKTLLSTVEAHLKEAHSQRRALQSTLIQPASLVNQIIDPLPKSFHGDILWFKYEIQSPQDQSSWMRRITAHQTPVEQFSWFQSAHLEIFLHRRHLRILATPLGKIDDTNTQQKQIQTGDLAILMGHFVVIAILTPRPEKEKKDVLRVKNCFRIEHVIETPVDADQGEIGGASRFSTNDMSELYFL